MPRPLHRPHAPILIFTMVDIFMYHKRVEAITVFLNQYKWLLDCYVIEFFTEDHWSKLPSSWRESLDEAHPKELGYILLNQSERCRDSDGVESRNTCCCVNRVYPLSLLAFAATAKALSLPRHPRGPSPFSPSTTSHHAYHDHRQASSVELPASMNSTGNHKRYGKGTCISQVSGVDHCYRRHVKPKKQHEIKCLAEVISNLAREINCHDVIDVGSGRGHLARYLAYNYGLNVTAVEAIGEHLTAAAKFDGEIEKEKAKKKRKSRRRSEDESLRDGECFEEPLCGMVRHVQSVIKPGCSITEFLSLAGLTPPTPSTITTPILSTTKSVLSSSHRAVQVCVEEENRPKHQQGHILVGLHTCGDLGATMMKVFRESEEIVGLVSLGCCYMKLSSQDGSSSKGQLSPPTEALGYPLSEFVGSLLPRSSLSYEAREVACHSIDSYSEQLHQAGERDLALDHLKVHCHRAVVETVLRKNGVKRRSRVRITKRVSKLPFREYSQRLLESVGLPPMREVELRALSLLVEKEWRKVVIFFLLRLAIAPCVESLLLLDRVIFLQELNTKIPTLSRHRIDVSHTHHKPVQVRLAPIFDSVISPRNIALIAKR